MLYNAIHQVEPIQSNQVLTKHLFLPQQYVTSNVWAQHHACLQTQMLLIVNFLWNRNKESDMLYLRLTKLWDIMPIKVLRLGSLVGYVSKLDDGSSLGKCLVALW